jgi:outer membrane immunogenic protein
MKKLALIAAVSVLAMPAFAHAQEWTGTYVGAELGYGKTEVELRDGTDSAEEDFSGANLGGFIGYAAQKNRWVYAVEGDLRKDNNSKEYDVFGDTLEMGTEYSASLRARVGYTVDKAQIYATGGFGMTQAFIEFNGDKESESFYGPVVGAGVDYAFSEKVFGRAEFRVTNYGDKSIEGANVDLDDASLFVGVAFKY